MFVRCMGIMVGIETTFHMKVCLLVDLESLFVLLEFVACLMCLPCVWRVFSISCVHSM